MSEPKRHIALRSLHVDEDVQTSIAAGGILNEKGQGVAAI